METEISDWDKALTEGTAEYETLIAGMDKAAEALKELQEQDIPVLWRPFHEFDGGWFWWGKGGPENFKKLWIIMYDRYTKYHQLDYLIWVLGYSGNGKDYDKWYPGDEYVDIIGADSYTDGANENLYEALKELEIKKMPICFHECGRIPTVEQLQGKNAGWVWFMTCIRNILRMQTTMRILLQRQCLLSIYGKAEKLFRSHGCRRQNIESVELFFIEK